MGQPAESIDLVSWPEPDEEPGSINKSECGRPAFFPPPVRPPRSVEFYTPALRRSFPGLLAYSYVLCGDESVIAVGIIERGGAATSRVGEDVITLAAYDANLDCVGGSAPHHSDILSVMQVDSHFARLYRQKCASAEWLCARGVVHTA